MKTQALLRLSTIGFLSIVFVIVLFLLSEHEIHRNNAFVRRYPHHPIARKYDLPIKFNSYYIAGYENGHLYLGNSTAPLHLLKINLESKDTSHLRIKLNTMDHSFRSVSIKFSPPYFFVMDGSVPCIYQGKIGNWNASEWMVGNAYFTNAIPIDSNNIYIKSIKSSTNVATLGLIQKTEGFNIKLYPELLEKQIDGLFCVDGTMLASLDGRYLGYVYYYRNQFMVMNSELGLLHRETTIDTIKKAQIRLAKKNKNGEIVLKSPPKLINKTATLYGNLLLINSNRLGKYEEQKMLDQASIIDVYNWKKSTYNFSFYLYNLRNKRIREFGLFENKLVALIDDHLSVYVLKQKHFDKGLAQIRGSQQLFTNLRLIKVTGQYPQGRDRKPVEKSRS